MGENPTVVGTQEESKLVLELRRKTSPMLSTREITDEGCMDSRPHERRAAEKCDELPLPHGIFPKAKDHKSSIAGQGPCIATKAVNVCFGSKAEKLDLSIKCPLYPRKRTSRAGVPQPDITKSIE